ncbi:glycoside hydrolase family 3 protein [Paenibacillus abyssi]|uniref:beta-N-acetylhexosaminidase n=1 Tax=Paenibacillus abyssi TaxID=1340531 RepID=A0A917FRX9_9BACL|nr:glycoside hydrolase family 3 N-terminal domain-containing protein [Paenibacillus abyssi]GGG00447.1 beta-N-acetylhexosaminidase [Paenibacillus abyssi]
MNSDLNMELQQIMGQMSLEDKVAQLFTFSALAARLDDASKRLITELKVGGIFLGTGCLQQPKQVYELTTAMQQASISEGSGIPLFISADFVAGAGCKLQSGAVHFPKNRAIGAADDERLACESGRVTALESLAMGVNFNYSPVVDINNNPLNPVIGTHSFGEDRETVSRLGCAVIKGYQEHGMIATAKHFPGHGDTHVDSHEDLPVLPFSRERLESFELVPFRRAIEQGVDAVMVGHIAVPALDPSNMPASLSYELTTKLLREQLNFQGLIVTDGLTMKGITNQFTLEEACIRALLAGADILLGTAESYEHAASMLQAVTNAVEQGRIPVSRIEESVKRVLMMKQKYRLMPELYRPSGYREDVFQTAAAEQVSEELAAKAATPLNGMDRGKLKAIGKPESWLLIRDAHATRFAEHLRKELLSITERTADHYEKVLELLDSEPSDQGVILAISHNKPIDPSWLKLLNDRLSRSKHAVWVHFGSEYDVRQASVPCLLMYDRSPSLQHQAAHYLCAGNTSQ